MKTRITIALAATVLVGACAGNPDDAMQAAEGDAAAASFRSPPDLDPILAPHIPRAAWRVIFKESS